MWAMKKHVMFTTHDFLGMVTIPPPIKMGDLIWGFHLASGMSAARPMSRLQDLPLYKTSDEDRYIYIYICIMCLFIYIYIIIYTYNINNWDLLKRLKLKQNILPGEFLRRCSPVLEMFQQVIPSLFSFVKSRHMGPH